MSARRKNEVIETIEDVEGETIDVNTEFKASEAEISVAPEAADEVNASVEEKESSSEMEAVAKGKENVVKKAGKAAKVDLNTLAKNLFQIGLDLGLEPDEVALLTGETKLPSFIDDKGESTFREGLIEAYQEMLDDRMQSLKHRLGLS